MERRDHRFEKTFLSDWQSGRLEEPTSILYSPHFASPWFVTTDKSAFRRGTDRQLFPQGLQRPIYLSNCYNFDQISLKQDIWLTWV